MDRYERSGRRTAGVGPSRRQFVRGMGAAGLALVAGCGRLPGQGQATVAASRPARVYRVGFMASAAVSGPQLFRDAMTELGYVEGENLLLESRLTGGEDDIGSQARELVNLGVEVIAVSNTAAARVAREATETTPIVNAGSVGDDLIEAGLAASLARPGGNVTGLTTFEPEIIGKRLQLLTEVVPGASRIAVLWAGGGAPLREPYERAAQHLGIELEPVELRAVDELDGAFDTMTRAGARALNVRPAPLLNENRARIAELAIQHQLPTMGDAKAFADLGGLMGFQARTTDTWRRAAMYVDRILKGAKPADLPIERLTTFDFVINLKTAQALGLTIPQHVLRQATEVIQ